MDIVDDMDISDQVDGADTIHLLSTLSNVHVCACVSPKIKTRSLRTRRGAASF